MPLTIKKISFTDDRIKHALAIRKVVFTDEQGIPHDADDDGYDHDAVHALAFENDEPVGVGRLVIKDKLGVLARIAVLPNYRGHGYAAKVVEFLEKEGEVEGINSFELYPHTFLERFYSRLGYKKDHSYQNKVAGYDLIRMYK